MTRRNILDRPVLAGLLAAGLGLGTLPAAAEESGLDALGVAALGDALAMAVPHTGEPHELTMAYGMYLGGLTIGEARMVAHVSETGYDARSTMRTAGLADLLFKSRYRVRATGAIEDGVVRPLTYDSDFRGPRDKYQIVRLAWDGLDPGPTYSDPEYGRRLVKWPVSPDQKHGSVDPLSSMLHVVVGSSVSEAEPCGSIVPVFDGRRRFNFELSFEEATEISVRRGDVHDGPALRCAMIYRRVAGYKWEDENGDPFETPREEDEFPVPPLTVWMSEDHHPDYLVPVRITAPTPFGTVVLILEQFNIGPAPLMTAENQRTD